MYPARTALQVSTLSVLTPPSHFSLSTSATFTVFDLNFNLQNTTSPLLNLIFFSLLKHRCQRQLTLATFLFPPTFSILIFILKLDVASMYATIYHALIPILLNHINFLPSDLNLQVTLLINSSVLLLSPLTTVNSLIIQLLKWSTFHPSVSLQRSPSVKTSMFTTSYSFPLPSLTILVNQLSTLLSSMTKSNWCNTQLIFLTTLEICQTFQTFSLPITFLLMLLPCHWASPITISYLYLVLFLHSLLIPQS